MIPNLSCNIERVKHGIRVVFECVPVCVHMCVCVYAVIFLSRFVLVACLCVPCITIIRDVNAINGIGNRCHYIAISAIYMINNFSRAEFPLHSCMNSGAALATDDGTNLHLNGIILRE